MDRCQIKREILELIVQTNADRKGLDEDTNVFSLSFGMTPTDLLYVFMELKKKYPIDYNQVIDSIETYSVNGLTDAIFQYLVKVKRKKWNLRKKRGIVYEKKTYIIPYFHMDFGGSGDISHRVCFHPFLYGSRGNRQPIFSGDPGIQRGGFFFPQHPLCPFWSAARSAYPGTIQTAIA